MTDLESPKKNNDCYFYYYSTCAKGDNCTFRHEPSALGCETMCSFWKEGKCLNVHCNFRHMELRKNRKVIPCYWESQPIGCLKAHCPFMHQNPRPNDGLSPEKSNISVENSDSGLGDQLNQSSERKVTAVDSLVVNFEEESDGESGPTFSPDKFGNRIVRVKTLEEIKLEKIQAESAAYYSYHGPDTVLQTEDADDLRQRIVRRIISKNTPQSPERTVKIKALSDDRVQINKRLNEDETSLGGGYLRKRRKTVGHFDVSQLQIPLNKDNTALDEPQSSRFKKIINKPQLQDNVQSIRIKTLDEIRAERNARNGNPHTVDPSTTQTNRTEEEESEVSSTCMDEDFQESTRSTEGISYSGLRKIKLRRKLHISDENVESSNDNKESSMDTTDNSRINIVDSMFAENVKENEPVQTNFNKIEDEVLLLDDDDDSENVSLRAEEELLEEIDSLLES
ncbi:hypothetical protein NQ317_006063 [Molorchus minor]|uniref:C3H1-type domain-containing protein n=1 Tax=Molorchus minor TaxID=1323400 RepID=A0ABQ9K1V3_9CUCU|nr:hypothetical protein NQ317_006063 [Molorchus minor]